MTNKTSEERTNRGMRKGDVLNYTLGYEYHAGYAHRAEKIGNMYYRYDGNGNVVEERYGGHGAVTSNNAQVYEEAGGVYGTDYGFALTSPGAAGKEDTAYRRDYRWNERNQLVMSVDNRNRVRYRYGADGERAVKYTEQTRRESLYFNKYYQMNYLAGSGAGDVWEESKHVFMGETRIATKRRTEGNAGYGEEREKQYYYHGDHLGSAQLVTNREGKVYEHLEYTPYGELRIEEADTLASNRTPFRFTGKERDEETGLYYYGARYLDPQTSRWLSVDPAMGEYVPLAPIDDEARKRNGNLPGMGGVFNLVNLHVYHYAGNNPVVLVDPDGRISIDDDNKIIHADLTDIKDLDKAFGEFIRRGGEGYKVVASDHDGMSLIFNSPNTLNAFLEQIDSTGFDKIKNCAVEWWNGLDETTKNRITGGVLVLGGALLIVNFVVKGSSGLVTVGDAKGFVLGIEMIGLGAVQLATGRSMFGKKGPVELFIPAESEAMILYGTNRRY
jgi:RHS repeat-associated protein